MTPTFRKATVSAAVLVAEITLSAALTAPRQAHADVNMMEASYQTTFIDLEIGGLKIMRRYNSRSNFTGLFGFGWCSTFDTKLEFSTTPSGDVSTAVRDCGKLTNIGRADNVQYKNAHYIQSLNTGLVRTFDATTGELVSLRTISGPEVQILRSPPPGAPRTRLLRDAALAEGSTTRQTRTPQLNLSLDFQSDDDPDGSEHLLRQITSTTGSTLLFSYSPARDLLFAKNAWQNTYRFEYDPLHNLTTANYPDQTQEHMTYDADHDRLLKFEGRDLKGNEGCTETFDYSFRSPSEKILLQTSTSKLLCTGKTPRTARFDFRSRKQKIKPASRNSKLIETAANKRSTLKAQTNEFEQID